MADYPAMPLWTDAYIADCSHLEDAEHGRYLLLLIALWRSPQRRLPNNDGWLARKFSRSIERVQAELRPLITEFCDCDGNWITQKRLQREFTYVANTSLKQSVRAKRRWQKEKDACRGNAAAAMPPHPHPYESSSSSSRTVAARELRGMGEVLADLAAKHRRRRS
jgi:uncharacterized protein YdaU (DUF1376 family)